MEPYLRVLVTLLALFVFLSVPASADSLIIVESVSELLTVDAVDGSLVFVKGFYEPGDGGEGFFRYDAENIKFMMAVWLLCQRYPVLDLDAYQNRV